MSGLGPRSKSESKSARPRDKKNSLGRLDLSGHSDSKVSLPYVAKRFSLDYSSTTSDTSHDDIQYETILEEKKGEIEEDPLKHMILFPENDVEVMCCRSL